MPGKEYDWKAWYYVMAILFVVAALLAIFFLAKWRGAVNATAEPFIVTEIIEPECECTWDDLNHCLEERKACQNNRDERYADYLGCRDTIYFMKGDVDGFRECMKAFDYRMCKAILP